MLSNMTCNESRLEETVPCLSMVGIVVLLDETILMSGSVWACRAIVVGTSRVAVLLDHLALV